jgi:hypothetical protein
MLKKNRRCVWYKFTFDEGDIRKLVDGSKKVRTNIFYAEQVLFA